MAQPGSSIGRKWQRRKAGERGWWESLPRLALACLAAGCAGGGAGKDAAVDGAVDVPVAPTPGSPIGMQIERVEVDSNRRVRVDFRVVAPDGSALDHRGFTINWTLAMLTVDATTGAVSYTSLILRAASGSLGTTQQSAAETGGTYQEQKDGSSRYLFAAALPDIVDLDGSFRVGAWAQEIVDGGTPRVANATADFVASGKGSPQDLDSVATAACNQCHDPLSAHGGARREVELCVTCHTPQLFDPDTEDPAQPGQMNPLDFQALIHRIHDGPDLPTVVAAQQAGIVGAKYDVIGFQGADNIFAQTVAGGTADGGALAEIRGGPFPRDLRDCTVCHQQAPAAATWQTVLSQSICGSCHDATWFAATPPPALHHAHPGGPMADDHACTTCHAPSGAEFDLSVAGAHTMPGKSTKLRGLHAQIIGVQGSAGTNPALVFQVSNGDGSPVAPLSTLDVLAATVSGPTSAYRQQNMIRQDVRASAQPNPDGTWSYQFPPRAANDPWFPSGPVIPTGAQGTFAIGLECRRAVALVPGVSFEEASDNPVAYFSVDGSTPSGYPAFVDLALCDRCHGELRAHGNLRRNPAYCVLCHAADASDWAERPKGPDGNSALAATVDHIEERSIRFPLLIHRIHTGDELVLTVPFVVYGFGGSANRFDDVVFPGNRADCATCHLPNRYTLEAIPATALPTIANETATILHQATPVHPPNEPGVPVIQSTCLSCHDIAADRAHASLETTSTGVEACLVCHGEGRQASVRSVHLAH